LQTYQKALSLKSDYPEALYRMGELKAVQGDQQGAVKALIKALKLKPDHQEAKATLGTVYGQQGAQYLEQGNWSAAASALKEAVALNPQDDAAFNNLGAAYAAQGDYDQAIDAFQSAVQANPGNVDAHYNLGSAYLQTGDKNGVLGQYAVLGNLDPALAGQLFEQLSFPRGKSDYAKETPQYGQTGMRPSLPAEIAVSPPPLPDPLRDTPDLQGPPLDSKLPAGQLR
jgi:tetratricopeptide (TPR) repeat protein